MVHIHNGILLSHKKELKQCHLHYWMDLQIIKLSEVSQRKIYDIREISAREIYDITYI